MSQLRKFIQAGEPISEASALRADRTSSAGCLARVSGVFKLRTANKSDPTTCAYTFSVVSTFACRIRRNGPVQCVAVLEIPSGSAARHRIALGVILRDRCSSSSRKRLQAITDRFLVPKTALGRARSETVDSHRTRRFGGALRWGPSVAALVSHASCSPRASFRSKRLGWIDGRCTSCRDQARSTGHRQ